MTSRPDSPDREFATAAEEQSTVGRRGVIILALIGVVAIGGFIANRVSVPDPAPEEILFPHVQEFRTGPIGAVHAVATAELDGRPVVVAGGDGTVRVWDLATRAPIGQPLTGHTGAVNAIAIAQLDGRPVIVSGSTDGTVQVWNLATGAPIGKTRDRPRPRHDRRLRRSERAGCRTVRRSPGHRRR